VSLGSVLGLERSFISLVSSNSGHGASVDASRQHWHTLADNRYCDDRGISASNECVMFVGHREVPMRTITEKTRDLREGATNFRNAAKDHQPQVSGTDRDRRAKAKREYGKWSDLREAANQKALHSEKR
jgi:hypothetical protein